MNLKVNDNIQLGIEAQAFNSKRLRLMEQVEAQQKIEQEHQIALTLARKEEEQVKAANQEQLRRL